MRWNCPHCETLVKATIDFENTKKAYVRCMKCKQMALIHRSAALAGYVKARRLEEEAQLEAEIRQSEMQQALENAEAEKARHVETEKQLREAAAEYSTDEDTSEPAHSETSELTETFSFILPPVPNAEMRQMPTPMSVTNTPVNIPPPVAMIAAPQPTVTTAPPSPPVMAVAPSAITDTTSDAAVPPPFLYKTPPAFLLRENTAALQAFSGTEETVTLKKKPRKKINPGLAVWIAAGIAFASGVYLFIQGQKALAPAAATISEMSAAGLIKRR